ncbi:hypothetical protein GSI_10414 [Ganoderma sinense ZZ0214-1]|uniref:Fungal-type protein kinase domain-containing protein n=1 Tax=Ganoderma sinense ZZ0214-1 TaxID=1077348 RepID=A0A2G8S0J6_9APHY|nr:hypothetical protein GSI_10414 [Ganoderma sinense ZZ0214-1]
MPPRSFLETFLRRNEMGVRGMRTATDAFCDIPEDPTSEEAIYKPLIEALNLKDRCPGYAFRDTSLKADSQEGKLGSSKPDITCYATRDIPAIDQWKMALKDTPKNNKYKDPLYARADMGLAAVFIEVKQDNKQDCFRDPLPSSNGDKRATWEFVLPSDQLYPDEATQALGQNVAYATEVLRRQHRHCCYSVFLFGCWARLARWDRAGAIVTETFNLHCEPELLCEFFWLFARLSEAQRGYDLTVLSATSLDEMRFRHLIQAHAAVQRNKRKEVSEALEEHYLPNHVVSMWIPSATSHDGIVSDRQLLVSRPLLTPLTFVGRSTRLYWAVDCSTDPGRIVLLKDTWRSPSQDTNEGTIIETLHSTGRVVNIPGIVCHGDVCWTEIEDGSTNGLVVNVHDNEYQMTQTQIFLNASWVCGNREHLGQRIFERRHYRLVLNTAGYNLLDLEGTWELLHGVYDAFEGHVHRGIDPWSVILYREPSRPGRRGYLINWDFSASISENYSGDLLPPPSSQSWQFQSEERLTGNSSHEIGDDMESMLWLLLYCGLLRLPHNIGAPQLKRYMDDLFDQRSLPVGEGGLGALGGYGKVQDLEKRTYLDTIQWQNAIFQEWLHILYDCRSPRAGKAGHHALQGRWEPSELIRLWQKMLGLLGPPTDDVVVNLDPTKLSGHLARSVPRSVVTKQSQMATSVSSRYHVGSPAALKHVSSIKQSIKVSQHRKTMRLARTAAVSGPYPLGTQMRTDTYLAVGMQEIGMSNGPETASTSSHNEDATPKDVNTPSRFFTRGNRRTTERLSHKRQASAPEGGARRKD